MRLFYTERPLFPSFPIEEVRLFLQSSLLKTQKNNKVWGVCEHFVSISGEELIIAHLMLSRGGKRPETR